MANADDRDGAHGGPSPALEAMVERHRPALEGYLRFRVGKALREHESCSDLTQSVCREILVDADELEFRDDRSFRSLLLQAADRKIVERHRYHHRQKRDVERTQFMADVDTVAGARSGGPSPSDEAELREEARHLRDALDELPDDYRQVLVLSQIVGLPHREIARCTGRSEVATRKMASRAIARLATLLKSDKSTPKSTRAKRDSERDPGTPDDSGR